MRSSFRDTGYSQKVVTYQMFDEKRSWITKYMPFSVFLLMIRYKMNEKYASVKQAVFEFLDQPSVHHGHSVGATYSTKTSAPALQRHLIRRDFCNGAGQSHSYLRSGVPYIFCRGGKVPSRRDKKYKGRLIAG